MKLIRNRLVIATFCVVLSAICVYSFIASTTNEDVTAYKLTQDISKGEQITSDMIQQITVGSLGLDGVLMNSEDIVGQYANLEMVEGQFIYVGNLSEDVNDVIQGFDKLEDGQVAYSISVSSMASSVADKIRSGDIVSVYINTNGVSSQPTELKYVEVLYATTSTGTEKTDSSEESSSTITLILTQSQANLMNEYEYTSNIHLAMVYSGDDDTVKADYLSQNTAKLIIDNVYVSENDTEE